MNEFEYQNFKTTFFHNSIVDGDTSTFGPFKDFGLVFDNLNFRADFDCGGTETFAILDGFS